LDGSAALLSDWITESEAGSSESWNKGGRQTATHDRLTFLFTLSGKVDTNE